MTIPKEWLKAGAVVPVNNDTVHRLIHELKKVPHWVRTSNFDEYSVHVRFNVSVPFEFNNRDARLLDALNSAFNDSLCELFKKQNGAYSNPRIDLEGITHVE
jgi:hypothetical protein